MEKIFARGLRFSRRDVAPVFVIGNLSVKVDEFIEFLKENENKGWVNMIVMKSKMKTNEYYVEIDTWQPVAKSNVEQEQQNQQNLNNFDKNNQVVEYPEEDLFLSDIPF